MKKSILKYGILIDQVLYSGSTFVLTILLGRELGLHAFGVYVLLITPALFFLSLQNAYITAPLFTLFNKTENKEKFLQNLNTQEIVLVLLGTVGTLLYTVCFSMFFDIDLKLDLIFSSVFYTALFLLTDYARRVYVTLKRISALLLIDFISSVVPVLIILVMILVGQKPTLFWALTIQCLFYAIGLLVTRIGKVRNYNWEIEKKFLHRHWNFSKSLVGTSVLQWSSGNLYLLVGGAMLGPYALGVIRIGQSILGVVNVVFSALENIVPLEASKILSNNGQQEMNQYFKKATIKYGVLVVIMISGIWLAGPQLLSMLVTKVEVEHVNVLNMLSLLTLLIYFGTIIRFIIRTLELNHIILYGYILSTVLSLLALYPLLKFFDLYGIVYGLFLAQISTIGVFFYHLKKASR